MEPGEERGPEAFATVAYRERLAIAMALAGVRHHTLPGARRPREQSRPSTLLEDCQRDTMILVSKVELNDWPVLLPALSLRQWRES